MDHNQDTVNNLKNKSEECIRKIGFDENFIEAYKFHLKKILLLKSDPSGKRTKEEGVNILSSQLFLDKMEFYPEKRFKSQVNENSAWPLPMVPPEIFAGNPITAETRKYVFYTCLRVGDYLDCRVTSSRPDSAQYELKVIHKYGVTRILDDLNIIVTMRKVDINELPQALKEFRMGQLVRVVVTEKEGEDNETKVFVSVIHNQTDLRSHKAQLGVIPEEVLPGYVLNPYRYKDRFSSYKDYLTSNPGFCAPLAPYEDFGINPRRNLSYFPTNERLSSVDVDAMLKESKMNDVKEYRELALDSLTREKFSPAIAAIDLAIRSFPKAVTERDKAELSQLYDIKSIIHASEKKPIPSEDSLLSLMKALKIDKTNQSAKIKLSRYMFLAANKYYRKKNYAFAARWASQALKLNENNAEAQALMDYLKENHNEAVDDFDEESIQALLEKHKAIGSELQKLTGEIGVPIVPYSFDASASPSPSSSSKV